jgi:hypothetical protein
VRSPRAAEDEARADQERRPGEHDEREVQVEREEDAEEDDLHEVEGSTIRPDVNIVQVLDVGHHARDELACRRWSKKASRAAGWRKRRSRRPAIDLPRRFSCATSR